MSATNRPRGLSVNSKTATNAQSATCGASRLKRCARVSFGQGLRSDWACFMQRILTATPNRVQLEVRTKKAPIGRFFPAKVRAQGKRTPQFMLTGLTRFFA